MKKSAHMAIVLTLGLSLGVTGGWIASGQAQQKPGPAVTAPPVGSTTTSGSFAKLAEAVKPAVINVSTQARASGGRTPLEDFYGEEFFKRFFGDAPERMPRRGLGSGVIIDSSGIALTNAHVVEGASTIEVVTLDGAKHKAKVIGTDKKTDLAVIQLDATKPYAFLPLGNSDEAQVGDWVIAVGAPFGLQATVTSGIISAKARQIGAGPYDEFIQTDAAINPGNSGGPLVNMRGEVVGINTAIVRGGSGIGFAIPSNLAKRVATDLRTSGKVTRGWLGVSIQPLTPELATSFGAKDTKGALVADVSADSPAARAGIKSGDVIVQFNGKKVEDPSSLARAVAQAKPGETSTVRVWRDRQEKTVELKLGELPAERTAAAPARGGGTDASKLGVTVQAVTPEIARQLDLKDASGVVVTRVDPDSAAGGAGIQRGDVILEIDRKPVKSVDDFEKLTASASGKQMLLRVQRGGSAIFIAMAPATN